MVRKVDRKKAISLCTILWSGVTVLCGFAQGTVSLALLRLGVGAGNSAYAALSTDMLTSWYKKVLLGESTGDLQYSYDCWWYFRDNFIRSHCTDTGLENVLLYHWGASA